MEETQSALPAPETIPAANPVSGPSYAEQHPLTGNTMQDLKNIAAELGMGNVTDVLASGETVGANQAAPQPAQPRAEAQPSMTVQSPEVNAQPVAEVKPQPSVEVPKKFLDPATGQVDAAKVQKAEENIDQAIARYKAKEREFQTLQNRVNNPPQQQSQQQPVVSPMHVAQMAQQANPYQPAQQLTPLEIQMAQDLLNESAAFGKPMEQAQAIALARVQARALSARYQADMEATESLRRRVEDAERTRELQGLINQDPELLTPGMVDTLMQIRQDRPWINQSPEPWKEAYTYYRGQQYGRPQSVSTPTPKGNTVPQVPVSPVARVQPTAIDPKTAPLADLEAEVRRQFPGYRGGRL
jgi:hypothetical protein